MAGRYSARGVDKEPGWVERRFREAFQQIAELRVGKISAVPGSVVTIQQIMTDPTSVFGVENGDTAVYGGTGDMALTLTHVPIVKSLQVKQNGHELETTDWTIDANVVTVSAASVVMEADDRFTAWYLYDAVTPQSPVVVPAWRDTAPQNLNAFLVPDDAVVGDLLVAVAMMPDTESVTALNGWTLVGVSDYVTHTAVGGGPDTRTYRLEVYAAINDGLGTVPTVSNAAAEDVVCAMSAFEGGANVTGLFDTLDDGTSASAPAMSPVVLRVWGTIGDTVTITPSRGTVVLSTNYVEIDIAMTIDTDPTAASASTGTAAGWCLASLVVTA